LLLSACAVLFSQTPPSEKQPAALPETGFYDFVAVGVGHDSFTGYSGELDVSVGYDFSRALEVETGLPFYFLSRTAFLAEPGVIHDSYRYSSFGDAFVKAAITPHDHWVDYQATVTVTAPTGAANVSTGQATWEWNSRVENDWWYLHPFGEFVLGNVPPVTPRLGAYKIMGFAAQVHAGNSFDMEKMGSFDVSFYESVPIGNAHAFFTGVTAAPLPPFNLFSDHGFTGDYSKPAGRFAFDLTYSRSIAHAVDALSLTVGYRMGHRRIDQ